MSLSILSVRSSEAVQFRDSDGCLKTNITVSLFAGNFDRVPFAIELQIKEADTTEWTNQALYPAEARTLRIWDVEVGVEYNIRIRLLYPDGTNSAWVNSWDDSVVSGASALPASVVNSHTVLGNTKIPKNVDTFNVTQIGNEAVRLHWTMTNFPRDLAGYELRYGAAEDWDTMTILATVYSDNYETLAIPSGTWYFAIKVLIHASDPTVPKSYNESTDAVYFGPLFTVAHGTKILVMGQATSPVALTTTYAAISNYTYIQASQAALGSGFNFNTVNGTFTTPNDGLSREIRLTAHVDFSGSGNNQNAFLAFSGSSVGLITFSSLFWTTQQASATAGGAFTRQLPPNETVSMGLYLGSGTSTCSLILTNFEMEVIDF